MSEQSTAKIATMLNKVPEVTIFFWIIKVLCTTVGETASDFLNVNLNLGLLGTSIAAGIALAIALFFQFRAPRYVPVLYWLNVALISIFGTLVTDNLTDGIGFPLEYSTLIFSGLLLATFALWYRSERTLSIHSIYTTKREAFYWLAVLFTFALGTATGDLYAEALGLGYATTGIIIAIIVALFAVAWRLGLNSILAFWVIYIMSRPLGASLGDLLTQSRAHGGIGLGATLTTAIFSAGIVLTVLYLAITRRDVTTERDTVEDLEPHGRAALQVAAVAVFFVVVAVGGYVYRSNQLHSQGAPAGQTGAATSTAAQTGPLGDLSSFKNLAQGILDAVNAGDWAKANSGVNDLEYAWDSAEGRLKSKDNAAWTHIDGALDTTFRAVRSTHPSQQTAQSALQNLLAVLNNP